MPLGKPLLCDHCHGRYNPEDWYLQDSVAKAVFECRNNMLFVETSAKTAANTSELFELVARRIAQSTTDVMSLPATAAAAPSELPTSQATS